MDFLTLAQIEDWIRNKSINFIGSAVTPWHAHGIDCAIHYLRDQGIKVNGLILIKPAIKQQKISYILSEKNFTTNCCCLFKSPATFDTRPLFVLKSLCRLFQSVSWYNKQCEDNAKKIIYIASPWHLDVSTFIHLHTTLDASYGFRLMLVEEGLSSYFPKIDTRQHLWNTLKTKKQGFRLIQSYMVAVAGIILRQRFEKKTVWTNLNLLLKENNLLQTNALSIRYYSKVLTTYTQENRDQIPTENLNGCVVICTMAYLHTEIQDDEDVRVLSEVVRKIKSKGLAVYIKPHPRDTNYHIRYAPLECDFLDCHCSVEALFVRFPNIHAVVSFSSTSLVTANLLFGLQGISILNLLDKRKFCKSIQEEMDSFLYCFSDIVKIPNNIEEFASSL